MAGITCDPQTLVNNAQCLDCAIPEGMKPAVMIYLLQQIAGLGALTPQQLADAAQSYQAIPTGMQGAVMIAATCQIPH